MKYEITYGKTTATIPFRFRQHVYFCYKHHKRWVARSSYVCGVWATDIGHAFAADVVGVILDNGWRVSNLEHLFESEKEAADFCIAENEKIYKSKKYFKLYNDGIPPLI